MKRYYIAYGSNLNISQMRFRCPESKIVGKSIIEDYQLLFKGSKTGSYLTIEPKAGAKVPVVVWSVSEKDEKALDRYEGFPAFYYKKNIHLNTVGIRTGKKREIDAFVYIMHEYRELGIPSTQYVATCLEGYRTFGFNIKYIFKALDISERSSNGNK